MRRQLRALAVSAGRELGWGVRAVRAELGPWHARAQAIPDPSTRRLALEAMEKGRTLVDGAALFWTLAARRCPEVLRLLVAFQTLLNFIDVALEREALAQEERPGNWMGTASDALDLSRPLPDGRIDRTVGDDGGYLGGLVLACRAGCAALPHYSQAHGLLMRETSRWQAFEIEHDRDRCRRVARMRDHAAREFNEVTGATSWELVGGASSLLTAMAVLALAADERTTAQDLHRAADAYVWVASAGALLDSYADQLDDAVTESHNWFHYYPSSDAATDRTAQVLRRAVTEASQLRNGERHLVIVASMAALSLSSDAARSQPLRASTATIARSGGSLTRLLIPILRAWRVANGQTS